MSIGVEAEEVSLNRWAEVPNSETRDRTRPMRRENGLRHSFPDRVTERTDRTGGFVDAVIQPRDTRKKLIQALEMLETKRDKNPAKKHGNIPL